MGTAGNPSCLDGGKCRLNIVIIDNKGVIVDNFAGFFEIEVVKLCYTVNAVKRELTAFITLKAPWLSSPQPE